MECLMQEHLERLDSITYEIRGIRDFEPDYMNLMVAHREVVFFQIQLVKNREVEQFREVLDRFNLRIAGAVIPIWSDYLESSIEVADKLWAFTRDAIYCRATRESFTLKWLMELMGEAKLVAASTGPQMLAFS